MYQVASIINSRPITPVSDDVNDHDALTPNHILLLRTTASLPPGIFKEDDVYMRKQWRQVQYLADQFWRRWARKYLQLLQGRQKWQTKQDVKAGDFVLIADKNTARNQWTYGRIIKTNQSSDGLVRSALVRTRNGTLDRPVNKLCLLERAMN
jgi:hypothetical protein